MAPTKQSSALLSNYQQLKQAIDDEDEDTIHSVIEKRTCFETCRKLNLDSLR